MNFKKYPYIYTITLQNKAMFSSLRIFAATISCLIILVSCHKKETTNAHSNIGIIPLPNKVEKTSGVNTIKEFIFSDDALIKDFGAIISSLIPNSKIGSNANVVITMDKISEQEGYILEVLKDKINIKASSGKGAFYAIQSLRQLITFNPEGIPCMRIEDEPRFSYRGMHLDVGRHFFDVNFIKKYIDILAMYKFNTFHWHLTEDQGWRIEIKKYPKLQEIAAFRKETIIGHNNTNPQQFDGKRYGGFYTQEEVKDIVKYATARQITIIPEIEMPGHAQAALSAYPELGCTKGPFEAATKWGVFEDVFCPNEVTFTFLEDVLTEVMALFPSEYIHIGGDECPKTKWKESAFCQKLIKDKNLKDEHGLQSYFIQRIEKFLNSKGRQIIGWDEILEGGLAPNATVMSWRGIEGGIAAARLKHKVIMTPTDYCYFDYYQSQNATEPLGIGGDLPLSKVYSYEPIPDTLNEEEKKYILGAQGNVWTEYMKTPEHVEYMVLPRMQAMAEINWTNKESKNYDDFLSRLKHHFAWWKKLGYNFADKTNDLQSKVLAGDGNGVKLQLKTNGSDANILYSIDKPLDASGNKYNGDINVTKDATIIAGAFDGNKAAGKIDTFQFSMHLGAGKKITLSHQPAAKYSADGNGSILNGILGSNAKYGKEWLGFEGKDFEALIDLGSLITVDNIDLRFFNAPSQWIYPPKYVSVFFSQDGKNFNELPAFVIQPSKELIINYPLPTAKTKTKYIKIVAPNYGIIPDGKEGAGHGAWLFVDEIVVK